jgi:hypothetical protein
MYSVIKASQQQILDSIRAQDVKDYEQLRRDLSRANTKDYQQQYRGFWAMNRASNTFCTKYFELLETGTTLELPGLLEALDEASNAPE